MVLCRTYASLNILNDAYNDGPPQHTASVSSAHYDLSHTTVLFRTPVASPSPISRQSSPLGPYQSQASLSDRPIFPRSKSDPSLYRIALMRCFKRSPRGRDLFRRKKIAITKPQAKNGGSGLLQVPEVDWEVVDGMA